MKRFEYLNRIESTIAGRSLLAGRSGLMSMPPELQQLANYAVRSGLTINLEWMFMQYVN